MPLTLIIKSRLKSHGRSDDHKRLREEGWEGAGLTDEQADKCEFLERQAKKLGVDKSTNFSASVIDKVE